ncbi:MAG: HAD-IC family P-type ATPase [bacterium]
MILFSAVLRHRVEAIARIVSRHVFLLINAIIFAVVALLVVFGDTQEGIFIALITVINIVFGAGQEISAWLTLEKLQLLAAPRVLRVTADGTESVVMAEDIRAKDTIKLKMGDQVPCDGVLASSHGFEVNEALITGESTAFLRTQGDSVLAGSIITSGSGTLVAENAFAESRIVQMTQSIKKYVLILSPIQSAINLVITYTSYLLLLVILFVTVWGTMVHESTIAIIQNIGALTSMLLPQGMVVIVTLLFSYGAAHMYRKNVLLQEINATEKFGRIKNLCMDKTGTLTSAELVVERLHLPPGVDEVYARDSARGYIKGTGDSSQTIETIKKEMGEVYAGEVVEDLPFSSSRQFGVARIKDVHGERLVLAGGPEVFLPHILSESEKKWMQNLIDTEAPAGKRLLCFVLASTGPLPKELVGLGLSVSAVFTLSHTLREGVAEAVQFFQNRGVVIRIISGDNPKTVAAVALQAGVRGTEAVITGVELEGWSDADYVQRVPGYTLFARIKPEQKEKIIEGLKQSGFTAMIGDGANDALAIKKADLGIAMFDGAQATRQVAGVVLVKNSFSDLPNGVKLADNIIQNIELCASLFFNQVFLGFFFFVLLALFDYPSPFTPLNITFINYFTVGLPGLLIFYWIIRPVHARVVPQDKSFLRQVMPFALLSALPQTLVAGVAFYMSLEHAQQHGPTSLVVLACIIVGIIFFMVAPKVYGGPMTGTQVRQLSVLAVFEVVLIVALLKIPLVTEFYNLKAPSLHSTLELLPVVALYVLVQWAVTSGYYRLVGLKKVFEIPA